MNYKIKVDNMTCNHCVMHITNAINSVDPKAEVDCNLNNKLVSVESESSSDNIINAIKNAGYNAILQ